MNILNQSPFLRVSRAFPQDIARLTQEIDKSYIDIANAVNLRTISLYSVNRSALNGESWFISQNQKQQGLRQVYTFTNLVSGSTKTIPHGLQFSSISTFTTIKGIGFVQASNIYVPIPYVSATNVTAQIEIFVDASNINIISGPTARTPINSGFVLLEWISNG